jgi:hypothetical protein
VQHNNTTELDDGIEMLDTLDERRSLTYSMFITTDLHRLYGPEEINVGTVVDRHAAETRTGR